MLVSDKVMIGLKILLKKNFLKKNFFQILLTLLAILTIYFTTYHNLNKKKSDDNFNKLLNNLYLSKTLENIYNNFEPRIKNINHTVKSGDTFNKILNQYLLNNDDKEK